MCRRRPSWYSELQKAGLAFVVRRVQTKPAFEQSLDEFAPDLVLADSKLPGFDGRSAVRVAIDDFGTGFSSLSRLSELPVDILQIDRSFVQRLTSDPATHAIVATIIALARAFSLDTVAEGVETVGQCEILGSLGCETSQGYLHSPAVAAEAIAHLLRTQRHSGAAR